MIRGAGTLFIERERRRDTHRVNRDDGATSLASGDVVAIFPEGTTTDGTTRAAVQELAAAADRRGAAVTCSRWRSATATPDGAIATAPTYVGDTSRSRRRSGACAANAALDGRASPCRPRCPRATCIVARSRAPPKRLSERLWLNRRARRHLVHAPIGQPDRGERAAPHAARVEHHHVRASSMSSSVDQWPHTTVDVRERRSGCCEPRREAFGRAFARRASRGTPSCRRPCRSAAACRR